MRSRSRIRMRDAVLERCAPRHQSSPCRGARGAGVKVGETRALRVEFIEIGRLQVRMTMAAKIAITLVIGHHQDDVRLAVLKRSLGGPHIG